MIACSYEYTFIQLYKPFWQLFSDEEILYRKVFNALYFFLFMQSIKRRVGYFLGLLSLFFIFSSPIGSMTGFVLESNFGIYNLKFFLPIIGSFMFLLALVLLTSRVSLDMLLVPGIADKVKTQARARRAIEALSKYDPKVIVASGGKTPGLDKECRSEAEIIYRELRAAGIKPSQIRIDSKSQDTIENLINSLRKAPHRSVGIVSNPKHLDRFEYLLGRAKEEGVVSPDVTLYRIETDETRTERVYDRFAKIADRLSLARGFKGYRSAPSFLKRIANYLFR